MDGRRLRIGPSLQRPFERSYTTDLFLQFRLGMPICLGNRLRRFAQIVKLAELVRDVGKHRLHRGANRLLTVGDDAIDWHGQRLFHFSQQCHQIPLRRAQETAGKQDLPGEAVADHPQHLVATVRLQAVEGEDDLALRGEVCVEAGMVGQTEGDQLLVALDQVRDGALS